MQGITELYLTNNQIGDSGAQSIATMQGITILDLDNNQIGCTMIRAANLNGESPFIKGAANP